MTFRQQYIELPPGQSYYDIEIEGIKNSDPVMVCQTYTTSTDIQDVFAVSTGVPSTGTLRIKFNKPNPNSSNTAMRVTLLYKIR